MPLLKPGAATSVHAHSASERIMVWHGKASIVRVDPGWLSRWAVLASSAAEFYRGATVLPVLRPAF